MIKLRLLPIVLFAASALLALKILAFVTGTGGFSMGPTPAIAAGGGGHGGEEEHPVDEPEANFEDPVDFEAPLDLAKEAEAMAKQPEGGGGGHGEAAGGHGAPAEGGHGEAPADAHGAPAEGGHGEAPADAHGAPADAHGEAAADAGHGEAPADAHAAPADAGHGEAAAPADAGHGEAPSDAHAAPADAGHGEAPADAHAAPAEGGHGEAAGGHGAAPKDPNVSTTRPDEFKPGGSPSEAAILEALSQRRQQLDKRETDIELRAKLLDAAEKRLQDRVDELRAIQSQIGGQGANGVTGAPADGGADAAGAEDPNAPPPVDPQTKNLISIYEGMKPKSAASVFNSLDLPVLLPLVKNMNPRKVGPILAAMDPKKAALVTAAMALTANQKPVIVRVEAPPPAAVPLTPATATPEPSIEDLPKIMPADPNAGG